MMYDLVIIGGGPGGYQAALRAAENNLKTALVEGGQIGGTCLNRGCVPTKLFLSATSAVTELESQKRLRLAGGSTDFDLSRLQNRKKSIVSSTRKYMLSMLDKSGVDIFLERGSLGEERTVLAGGSRLNCRNIIISTGSRSGSFPGMEPDHESILTSTDALGMLDVPSSLTVVGAGPVGLEIGQIFNRLGSRITLVEAMERVAPLEDEDVSKELARYLKREKWDIRTGVKVTGIEKGSDTLNIILDNSEKIESQKCLLALGRLPNTEGLNLVSPKIQVYGAGWIRTDGNLMAAPGIYAVGDVNGRSMYAHSATHQADFVLDHILGFTEESYQTQPPPACIYGSMETIRTGLTRKELVQKHMPLSISRATLAGNAIVQGHGQVQGFIKVFWSEQRVVGITGIGHGLSGLITLAQVIVDQKWSRDEVKKHIFAHPTLDEALREALLAPAIVESPDGDV